ncbi:MAG: fibronectin type III domain-containing protein [Treponema sp.]|jgi:hypothetical protein|nr:fibronectin type III domain-containing protein [Treponema sp.]
MDAPRAAGPHESGYGKVSVALTDSQARTVFPGAVVENYIYTFTQTSGAELPEPVPVNGVYTLAAGNWKVEVAAYTGAVNAANKAAEGEVNFTLADGENKQVRVPLTLLKTEGVGKFAYGIQYPEDAEITTLTLINLAEPPAGDDGSYDPTVTLYPDTSEPSGGNRITSQAEFELETGFYWLNVELVLGSMGAGKNEVVYIYDGLVSEFGTGDAPVVFAIEDFALPGAPLAPVPTVSPGIEALFVSWPAVNLATAYEVWYAPVDDSVAPQQWGDDVVDTSAKITGLATGTAYKVAVRAKNRVGSDDSAEISGIPFALRLYGGDDLTTPLDDLAATPGATPLDKAFNWIAGNAEQGGEYTIVLGADETQGAKTLNPASINNQTDVTVTLKGDNMERTIQLSGNGSLYTLEYASLTLVLGANITLRGIAANNSPLVTVYDPTVKLVMEEGAKITGNTASVSGTGEAGGVIVVGGATFIMNGGKISNNSQTRDSSGYGGEQSGGGGVRISIDGTFIMNDGEISGNSAVRGGGVYVNRGWTGSAIFTMNGGKISGNTVLSNYTGGAGVGVDNTTNSIFIMHGGEISGNGTVNNTHYGAGVYVARDAIFRKQPAEGSSASGVIYGYDPAEPKSNKVGDGSPTDRGHAVYVNAAQKREITVGETESLDTTQDGTAGGWTE